MTSAVPIVVEAVPEYTGLDRESADNYYRAGQRSALLSSEVINPFRAALRDYTEFDDHNRPEKETEVPCDIGEFRFVMKVTPTTKRPGYRDAFDDTKTYYNARLNEYRAGNRPVDVFTIENEPYISAEGALARIKKSKKKIKSNGIKIEITEEPETPAGIESVTIPLGLDMRELNEGNVRRYLEACALAEDYGRFIAGFEGDLLELTGHSNGRVPDQTEHMFKQIGDHIFHVTSTPYDSTSWGKVISGLDKEPGKKKPENGGDLVLVTRNINAPRLSIYNIRIRKGEHMIRLKGLLKRIEELVKENTETKVRQKPITHYPIV